MSEETPEGIFYDDAAATENIEAPDLDAALAAATGGDGGDNGGEDDIRVSKGRRIALIAVALVVVILGGSGAGYFFGLFDSLLGKQNASKTASIDLGVPVRHEFPMIKGDLKTGKCRSPLLRAVVVVEVSTKDLPRVEAMQLRINDAVQTYLRDFERQDMVGKKARTASAPPPPTSSAT